MTCGKARCTPCSGALKLTNYSLPSRDWAEKGRRGSVGGGFVRPDLVLDLSPMWQNHPSGCWNNLKTKFDTLGDLGEPVSLSQRQTHSIPALSNPCKWARRPCRHCRESNVVARKQTKCHTLNSNLPGSWWGVYIFSRKRTGPVVYPSIQSGGDFNSTSRCPLWLRSAVLILSSVSRRQGVRTSALSDEVTDNKCQANIWHNYVRVHSWDKLQIFYYSNGLHSQWKCRVRFNDLGGSQWSCKCETNNHVRTFYIQCDVIWCLLLAAIYIKTQQHDETSF